MLFLIWQDKTFKPRVAIGCGAWDAIGGEYSTFNENMEVFKYFFSWKALLNRACVENYLEYTLSGNLKHEGTKMWEQ